MDIAGLMLSFKTGTYTVTRTPASDPSRGRFTTPAQTTLQIDASVSQASGDDIERLPEGRRSRAAKLLFTTTFLNVGGQGVAFEADQVTIDGGPWEVAHVETWQDSSTGSIGYKCVLTEMLS